MKKFYNHFRSKTKLTNIRNAIPNIWKRSKMIKKLNKKILDWNRQDKISITQKSMRIRQGSLGFVREFSKFARNKIKL